MVLNRTKGTNNWYWVHNSIDSITIATLQRVTNPCPLHTWSLAFLVAHLNVKFTFLHELILRITVTKKKFATGIVSDRFQDLQSKCNNRGHNCFVIDGAIILWVISKPHFTVHVFRTESSAEPINLV